MGDPIARQYFCRRNMQPKKPSFYVISLIAKGSMPLMAVGEDLLIVRGELLMHRACTRWLGFLEARQNKSGHLVNYSSK